MQGRSLLVLFGTIVGVVVGSSSWRAYAAGFAIAATNVTMPSSGDGVSQFTITSIPLTGTIALSCGYSGTLIGAKLPVCPMTPPVAFQVNANGTLTGGIDFYPYGVAVPAGLRMGRGRASGLALAGVLMVGLGFRRRRWGRLMALMLMSVACVAGFSACGVSVSNGMTPGTYPYTISAVNEPASGAAPAQLATTTITVTVP
jgi:hypothetical protein